MKNRYSLLTNLAALLVLTAQVAHCQTTFNRLYPDGNGWPGAQASQTGDGFLLIAKNPYYSPSFDFVDIQTDGTGNQLSQTPTSFAVAPEFGRCFRLHDDNYACLTTTDEQKMRLSKWAPDGTLLWSKEYATESGQLDNVDVCENANGEFFLSGMEQNIDVPIWQYKKGFVMKISSNGDSLWTTRHPFNIANSYGHYFSCSATTDDGGVIVHHLLLDSHSMLRYDAAGNLLFNKHLFGCCSGHVAFIKDGGNGKTILSNFIAPTSNAPGPSNMWSNLSVMDESGNNTWGASAPYPTSTGWWNYFSTIHAAANTNEGGVVMAGTGYSTADPHAFYLAKYSPTGELLWNKYDYGFVAAAHFITVLPDDRIVVTGRKDGHTWMMLTDSEGNTCSPNLTQLTAMQCDSQSYLFENELITGQGTYTHVYQSQSACDSIVQLTITAPPADTNHISLELCLGDTSLLTGYYYPFPGVFMHESYYASYQGCDSLVLFTVTVYPETVEIDTILAIGATYNGMLITQDTQFVRYDTTAHGCVLTITENVTVGPSAVGELKEALGLRVFPNPSSGDFTLNFTLPHAANLHLEIIDQLGRSMGVISDNELFPAGSHQLEIDSNDWPPGLYTLVIGTNSTVVSQRIAKI